ncbi:MULTISPECIES: hydantoinase/oxoprolinase family protein [unclassified Haloarcula]|uniref:hydantoinase/oxoprolinase family protein n=1 Tax=unclassified Haloarcula TaxID=2624677 RepID=UPI000EF1A07E|nr:MULTISPECIES: hydantoinase/oxoprolinase family protein [unclassified Haloarcula]RLM34838.1 hydantoinase/oxoprolinase family protein [Haloarcula sp. Atlit-120R]RLM44252.1 hydantoinase/oxoprolinase family protein [Haloarcula sp. Atlit-47R]
MGGRRIGVDVGGTFTDVTLSLDGELVTAKVPSTEDQSEGVIAGIEKACEAAAIDPETVSEFSHAMTVSVNALLEEDGAKTALVTTDGFRDVLEIGRQDRPSLYDLSAEKPTPLVPRRRRFEVAERTTTDGIEQPVDESEVRAIAEQLREMAVESVAVSLLHAYAHPENETRVADILRDELDVPVSASHEVLAEFREYERTSTTAVDAYVRPAIDHYVSHLTDRARDLGVPQPRIMQANGGITDADTVRRNAVTTVLSGPAAGVVGAGSMAADEQDGLVTFDMGGTSSDVSLVRDGEAERTTEGVINERPIKTPMVDVETVGAGGGSIAWVDAGGALRIGPRSAGADPGPACYGKGGTEPTVTDANLVLGYIGESTSLGGELSLDADAAHDALTDLADEAGLDGPLDAARGVYRVANANMTRAIRSVTVERGYDPRKFGLAAFGGAGPMHAASIAASLDMDRVVIPRASGVLSAYGLLAADEKRDAVRTYQRSLDAVDPDDVDAVYEALAEELLAEVSDREAATVRYSADLRYAGQSFELTVDVDRPFATADARERFGTAHESAYGYRADESVELVNCRVTTTVERSAPPVEYAAEGDPQKGSREAVFADEVRETPVYGRAQLPPQDRIDGPAIIEGDESTIVVPPAWNVRVRDDGTLIAAVSDT